jgi:diadenosine tetraphosphatase ApaH/serine/threonine PP2A family protein phosphatase
MYHSALTPQNTCTATHWSPLADAIECLSIQRGDSSSTLIIALLSDVHGNLEALSACLNHASETGASRYAFLGDLVGYGADPQAVVDVVARYASKGAIVIKGNHDEAIEKTPRYMNDSVRAVIDWTRDALTNDGKTFLASLPLCVRESEFCFVHASAASPERWDYIDSAAAARRCIDAAQAPYTFCGHVHDQELYFEAAGGKAAVFRPVPGTPVPIASRRRWLAIVGSVGQPRDSNPAAAYAQFDTDRERITFRRVPYDHVAAARKIRAAGLPLSIAYRVEKGI